jgi:hypothetical protein
MSKFRVTQNRGAEAVQWRGDNLEEVKEFLQQTPYAPDADDTWIEIDDHGRLQIEGYKGISDEIEVKKDSWILFSFSMLQHDYRLVSISDLDFRTYFKIEPCIQVPAVPIPEGWELLSGNPVSGYIGVEGWDKVLIDGHWRDVMPGSRACNQRVADFDAVIRKKQ